MTNQNKLNIAIFCDTSPHEINGVSTSVKTKCDILRAKGHTVYLFTSGSKTKIDLENGLIEIKGIKLRKVYGYRMVIPLHNKIIKLCKTLKIDVIHADTEFGVGLLGFQAAKKYHIPIVYTYHTKIEDYTYYIFKDHFKKTVTKLVRKLTVKYVNRATETIVPGEDTKNYLLSLGTREDINVVPTGVNSEKFLDAYKNREALKKELKEKYNIKDDMKIVLCLGRVAREKSFDIALNRFLQYKLTYPDSKVKLVFVGDGPYLKDIKKTVKKVDFNGDIIFIGKIPYEKVQDYYAASDIYLNSSTTETQGLTYMEAMASNLLILTINANYLKGVIKHNDTGFIFDSQAEFNELVNNILFLNQVEADRIRKNAYEVSLKYSLENFYNDLIEIYNRAIKKGK